ncbi:MAG: VTT domain-containing protein [Gammaproteobacteria bacterium]|jgi:uncharacterized membrane protein YdjX (TVP38/TMEM64 family)
MDARDENNIYLRRSLIKLAGLCSAGVAVLAIWRSSAFGEYSDPDRLGVVLDQLSASPWAGAIVVVGFLLGSFIVFPVTAMIAATGIALGPVDGLLWASVGSFVGATANYGLARMLPDHAFDNWVGTWVGRMGQRFERGGIVPVMVARTFPFAPFTLINVVAGGARIPYRDFLIGSVLGMGPIIAALTILGDRLRGAWESPTALNFILLVVAVVAWFLLALSLQMLSNRWLGSR